MVRAALLASVAGVLAWPSAAEVATDGTLGRRVTLSGREVEIGADLGQVRGRNLFHSFERFGVESGGRVTFTGPDSLDNVVSRVTGGEASRIDGTLASRVPGADVWLVNPAGVVFGPGARLDVPGSFHASTADEVRFGDGTVFSAVDPSASTLSVARPEAFGFLGDGRPGAITVDRGVMEVPRGERLSLVGGDIMISAGTADLDGSPPTVGIVRAEAGTVTLAALGGVSEVATTSGRVVGDVTGAVLLTGRALVDSTGDGGGAVRIDAGRLRLEERSFVFADNLGPTNAGAGVRIRADLMEVADRSAVTADTFGSGEAGSVAITAGQLAITAEARVKSDTFGGGDAGSVIIDVARLLLSGSSAIASDAREGSVGSAGIVDIRAEELAIGDGGVIASSTFAVGDAGEVIVEAGHLLVVGVPGSSLLTGIGSQAERGSLGDAGTVSIRADAIELRDEGAISSTTFTDGAGGDVTIRAERLVVRAGGEIASAAIDGGDAGTVMVEAGRLLVSGAGSAEFTGIESQAVRGSQGDAGEVIVAAAQIELRDGGEISSSSFGRGDAGDVEVRAATLTLRDDGLIGSSGEALGRAGDVRLGVGTLLLDRASVRTEGSGNTGGRIEATASDAVVIRRGEVVSDGIVPATSASLITLAAPLIALFDGSRVTSLTGEGVPIRGSGEARLLGDLTFISEDSEVLGSSTVELVGVDNTIGTGLQLPPGAFLDAGSLLGESCVARRAGNDSSFTRAGRGGFPPSPDRPLTSIGSAPKHQALVPGGVLRVVSADCELATVE